MGSCLMGMKFQFCGMKKLWRLIAHHINTINTNELVHLKMVKLVNFTMCIFYISKTKTQA